MESCQIEFGSFPVTVAGFLAQYVIFRAIAADRQHTISYVTSTALNSDDFNNLRQGKEICETPERLAKLFVRTENLCLLGLVEKVRLAEGAHILRLYALDAVWTDAVERPDEVPVEELPSLRELTLVIDSVLAKMADHARALEGVFACQEEKIEAACARLYKDEQLTPEQKDYWRQMIKAGGGAGPLALKSMRTLASMADDERSLLAEKLRQIEAKGETKGDVRPTLVCGGLIGGSIAFALTGAWPAALLTAAAAGAYCGSHMVFNGGSGPWPP